MSNLDAIDTDATQESVERTATQLPTPAGFRILVAMPVIEDKTEGGIIKAAVTVNREEAASPIGFVVKLGPDAYKDTAKFPSGPWCKEGDFVLMRPYSGTRVIIHGKEFRIISDDQVEGVTEDPRGYSRAF